MDRDLPKPWWRRDLEMGAAAAALKSLTALVMLAAGAAPSTAEELCRIAVLGDSLVAGYGLRLEDAFPAQLEQRLREEGHDCELLNAGVAGDTSAGGLARLDWTLADRPTHVIVELGANDALRALPVEQMEANIGAILERLEAEGVPVLLAGMLAPPNLGREYGDAYAAAFERLAERHDVAFYPFFLEGVAGDPSLFIDDGLHPTAEGIGVVVERMLPLVVAWLGDGSGSAARADPQAG